MVKKILRIFSLVVALICVWLLSFTYKGSWNQALWLVYYCSKEFLGIKLQLPGSRVSIDSAVTEGGMGFQIYPYRALEAGGCKDCYLMDSMIQGYLSGADTVLFLNALSVLFLLYLVWFRERDWSLRWVDVPLILYFFYILSTYFYGWEFFNDIRSSALESVWGAFFYGMSCLTEILISLLLVFFWKDKSLSSRWKLFLCVFFYLYGIVAGYVLSYNYLLFNMVETYIYGVVGKNAADCALFSHLGLSWLVVYCMTDYEIMVQFCNTYKARSDYACKLAKIVNKVHAPQFVRPEIKASIMVGKALPNSACSYFLGKLESCIAEYRDRIDGNDSKPDL